MRAWQLVGANQPLRLIECDDPQPGPGEVVIDVRAAGLCHSDVGFLDGTLTPLLPKLPIIPGHEVAGVVTDVGADVANFQPGDRVAIESGKHGAPGWSSDGGFAAKCLASAKCLVKFSDQLSFAQAATATDAGQTAYGAVMEVAEVRVGERVGIVGLGGLGLTGARIAVLAGAEVYAAEPKREVWDLAKQRGVVDIVEDVRELASLRLDVIVDFAGFGTTTAGAISAVRERGRVILVGLGLNEATIATPELVLKEVTLRGARGGHPGTLQPVLSHMAAGELSIHTETIAFEDIPDALERLRVGDVVGRLVAEMP
ncbi:zinc-binding dehydrogenase [Mycobacterium bourgelatii]|uniref:Zinc-dependent alcohol dehydrogenase n=1 Tax=Mycobacterium bourgelatii TaxID=1273442 RepID=A0A7I9YPF0_MYCBU|nr:zinc-binding dehydrogenase [Mycobacterium bourgelatii]MCV6973829.1 zinc-binding dehydrogenase [Mycobacterium bourgelatii]GFG90555.1 zinc-dependent alcohol dehydrogenase [Mycobacterium bourgelatii]